MVRGEEDEGGVKPPEKFNVNAEKVLPTSVPSTIPIEKYSGAAILLPLVCLSSLRFGSGGIYRQPRPANTLVT